MLDRIVLLLLICDAGARRVSKASIDSTQLAGFNEDDAELQNVSSQLDTDFNLETVQGGLVPNTASGPALPISSFMYGFTCPFQEWYPELPANFGKWENALVDGYKETYASKGSPIGIRENDHNFGTLLGQGNTLGFVTAKLTLGEGPDFTKFGLFAESGTLDAVLRFSDFGSDTSTTRFTRIALKLPLKTAWGNEVNLLFTETMDSFPISNYGQLGVSLGGGHGSIIKNIWYGAGFAASAAWVLAVENFGGVVMGKAFKKETLAKSFYSQLPYALGEKQAMKFSLVPKQKTCKPNDIGRACCLPSAAKPTNATDALKFAKLRAGAIAKFLETCDAEFEMQLQVKQRGTFWNDRAVNNASSSWSESPVKVGTLTIPRQACDTDTGVGQVLREKLAHILNVEPQGVDKMFGFHPVATHQDNRPIGDVGTFRAGFYSQHTAARFATYENGVFKKKDGTRFNRVQHMPFDALKSAGAF